MKIGNFDIFSSEEEPEIHMEVIPISLSEMAKDVSEDQEESEEEEDPFPEQLPILPVKNMVLFPGALSSITIRRDSALELINDARHSRLIGVVSQRSNEEEATPENLYSIGVVAHIIKVLKTPEGTTHILVQGRDRFQIESFTATTPYIVAKIKEVPEIVSLLGRSSQGYFLKISQRTP